MELCSHVWEFPHACLGSHPLGKPVSSRSWKKELNIGTYLRNLPRCHLSRHVAGCTTVSEQTMLHYQAAGTTSFRFSHPRDRPAIGGPVSPCLFLHMAASSRGRRRCAWAGRMLQAIISTRPTRLPLLRRVRKDASKRDPGRSQPRPSCRGSRLVPVQSWHARRVLWLICSIGASGVVFNGHACVTHSRFHFAAVDHGRWDRHSARCIRSRITTAL